MTQRSYFWNGLSIGDAVLSPYDAEALGLIDKAKYLPDPSRQGVLGRNMITSPNTSLYPYASASYRNVNIYAGYAIIDGYYYYSDAVTTLVMAASSPYTWWIAVLRANPVTQTVRLALKGPYVSEGAAMASVVQTDAVWEIPIATAYQKPSPTLPDIYDKRVYAINNHRRRMFVPVLGGFNSDDVLSLVVDTDMGLPMIATVNTYAYGAFILPRDYMDQGIFAKPCFVPLGSTIGGADVYIGQEFDAGLFSVGVGAWDDYTWADALDAYTITPLIVNQPLSLDIDPSAGMYVPGYLYSCFFQRDSTNVNDTFGGTIYFSGWEIIYESYY